MSKGSEKISMLMKTRKIHLKGTPLCGGIAIGKPFFFTVCEDVIAEFSIPASEVKAEIRRFSAAIEKTKNEILRLQKTLEEEGSQEGVEILNTHLQLLEEDKVTSEVIEKIEQTLKNAEFIFYHTIKEIEERFEKIDNPYFKERVKDIRDVYRRVLNHLKKTVRVSLKEAPKNSIVFADEIAPSDTAEVSSKQVNAFVTKFGGITSHAAIMAKARGIPFISGVNFFGLDEINAKKVIVDGRTGDVIFDPDESTLKEYKYLQKKLLDHSKALEKSGALLTETFDGYKIRLSANVEEHEELDQLLSYGDHGVGLFRSEYLFLSKERYPTEEEQYKSYKQILQKMGNLPVVIRTFDIGGDKLAFAEAQNESNPFLGCRAIRLMLKEKDIFKAQLRAILRASVHGKAKILFPMISGVIELVEAKKVLDEVKQELTDEKIDFDHNVPIGCMIEVPSAAITCDVLAKECDFLSIGTNDLVQYSLAVDRANEQMSYLYRPTDPSVIRLIKMIVDVGNRNHIPVGVCGEIAANPLFTPLLLGLGIHELSVASRFLPIIKNTIRVMSIVSASKLAERILSLPTANEVEEELRSEYQKLVPDDPLIYKPTCAPKV